MDYFLGRRPILTIDDQLKAYSLIVEPLNVKGEPRRINRDVGTAQLMIRALLDHESTLLAGRHPVTLPVGRVFVEAPELICWSPDHAILSLHAELAGDAALASQLMKLLDAGYRLAIDDFEPTSPVNELTSRASLCLVDASTHAVPEMRQIADRITDVELVAKNVDSREQLDLLVEAGFSLFGGDFWKKIEPIPTDQVPGNRLAVTRLIIELSQPDCSIDKVEHLVALDPSLTLRLLRYINSPASGLTCEVDSIRHAIVLTGLGTIKNWVLLLAVADLGTAKVQKVQAAFVRARFCEDLAEQLGETNSHSFFTGGLLSLMDTITGLPMQHILDDSPLADEIKTGILCRTGPLGEAIQLAIDLEEGLVAPISATIDIPLDQLATIYINALAWAIKTTSIL